MGSQGWCESILAVLLEYDTVKFVTVKNKKVGLLHRVLQITILGYIIGYVLIAKKGYQEFSDIQSAVTTKVKGVVYSNFTDDQFVPEVQNPKLYNRAWDITDLVIPPSENNAFFIATNVIITPDQTLSTCAESPDVHGAICDPNNNTCVAGQPFLLGNGVATGNCSLYNATKLEDEFFYHESESEPGLYTCEIYGWCPLERDLGPLNNVSGALLSDTGNFTVLIKNFINFPLYGVSRRNILNTQNKNYLTSCHYNPDTDPLCPVFVLRDMVKHADYDYDEMAIKGGVMGIVIDWNCDLDYNQEHCMPTYSFKRLDNKDAALAPGWNFRYANYFSDSRRTLYKLFGIDFVVVVTGRGGRFNIIPLLLNVGSGLGLMAMATVIADICILYVVKKRDIYKSRKYHAVQTEYDEFRNPDESAVRRRTLGETPQRTGYTQSLEGSGEYQQP